MLEKKIKKTLIETKEKKERLLIEQKIVKDRVSILFEGINSEEDFNKLSKKQKLNLSIKFLHEMSYLQNTGLINEQNFGNILSSLFGGWFGNAIQTFVEPVLKGILVPWFGEGYFTNFIIHVIQIMIVILSGLMHITKIYMHITKILYEKNVQKIVKNGILILLLLYILYTL